MSNHKKNADHKCHDRHDNGVIAVSRCIGVSDPYSKEKIPDYLGHVDHSAKIENKKHYKKALLAEETRFNTLVRQLQEKHRFLMIVFQGRDAAGKSGATHRIMDAVGYDFSLLTSVPIKAPTEEELAHPYLWRFFKGERMPQFGQVRVFDRSWNERLLVEPVMKLTPPRDIRKSYGEIRQFESLLTSTRGIVVKIWMDISRKEQEQRFQARAAKSPWKLGKADKEARKHWDDYTRAANEMFHRTGTKESPWYIISSEDKRYSRVAALQTINGALTQALKGK